MKKRQKNIKEVKKRILDKRWASLAKRGLVRPRSIEENQRRAYEAHAGA